MAPDRTAIDTMLREAAPDALKCLHDAVLYGSSGYSAELATVRIRAAEALLRCLASFPDPYAQPLQFRREVSR